MEGNIAVQTSTTSHLGVRETAYVSGTTRYRKNKDKAILELLRESGETAHSFGPPPLASKEKGPLFGRRQLFPRTSV